MKKTLFTLALLANLSLADGMSGIMYSISCENNEFQINGLKTVLQLDYSEGRKVIVRSQFNKAGAPVGRSVRFVVDKIGPAQNGSGEFHVAAHAEVSFAGGGSLTSYLKILPDSGSDKQVSIYQEVKKVWDPSAGKMKTILNNNILDCQLAQ